MSLTETNHTATIHVHAGSRARKRGHRPMAETANLLLPYVLRGFSPAAIARVVNMDRTRVASQIAWLELATFKEVETPFSPPPWQDLPDSGRRDWIEAGLDTGRAPGQVAVALGTQPKTLREWCQAHELLLPDMPPPAGGYDGTLSGVHLSERKSDNGHRGAKSNRAVFRKYEASPVWDAIAGSSPVHLLNARRGQCMWPVFRADDSERPFCGAATVAGRSYCDHHCATSARADQSAEY